MATEFTVILEDRPGALADLTEILAKGAVNIVALHATPCPQEGFVQFITSNADATILALRDAEQDYQVQEVLLAHLPNEPGTLARLSRALGDGEVNINSIYITMTGEVVLAVDEIRKAQDIVMSLGFFSPPG